MARQAGALVGTLFVAHTAAAQFVQQGGKLVGTGAASPAGQGSSVVISANGNTAIVGGPLDHPTDPISAVGAAWVFTRSGGAWSQQGSKLVGTGSISTAEQGVSVSISADGTTAIVGGPTYNFNVGAGWVFVSSAVNAIPMLGGLGPLGLAVLLLAVGAIALRAP